MTIQHTGVRFVIIGLGHIGQRYADLLSRQNGAELVGIVDIKVASAPSLVPFYASIDALIDDELEFDIAIIATPNGLHVEHAVKVLESGRHVLIEKPIALNTSGVNTIYQAAARYGKKVFPVFQNRYAHANQWLKQLLDSRSLGDLYMVQVNCFWNRNEDYYAANHWHGTQLLDGGVLYTQFSHYIDSLLWLFGPLKATSSNLYNFKHKHNTQIEDSGVVQFDFVNHKASGVLSFTTATYTQNYESSILIIAEKGTVKLGGQYMDRIVYQHMQSNFPSDLNQDQSNHQLLLDDVVQKLQSGLEPGVTHTEVAQAVGLIESIYELSENNIDPKNTAIFAS